MFKIQRWIKGLAIGLALGATASPALGAVLLTGVIHDSRTREPIRNAQVQLWNAELGAALDRACYLYWDEAPDYDPVSGQPLTTILTTGANGVYSVVLEHGHPTCPDTVAPVRMEMRVSHPDYMISSLVPAEGGAAPESFAAYGITNRDGAYFVSDALAAPSGWPRPPYWSEWRATKITTPVLNHHIPLDARAPRPAELSGVVRETGGGGEPIPGARIVVSGPNGQPLPAVCLFGEDAARTADPEGGPNPGGYLYRIDIGADAACPSGGIYTVTARPPAGSTAYPPAAVDSKPSDPLSFGGRDQVDPELTPVPAPVLPAELTVVVRDSESGETIPGARVVVSGPNGQPLPNACLFGENAAQTADAAGRHVYRIDLGADAAACPSGGIYTATAVPPAGSTAYPPAAVDSRTSDPLSAGGRDQVDPELTPVPAPVLPAELTVVVRDSESGETIPGARVVV
ncbi:hypothetical protein, partial [Neomegalonema sp.]|uniref:hypothetical protein n=1 Tax=Neomegalonema sp. TaxID=2039713 RepID=UPI00262AC43A